MATINNIINVNSSYSHTTSLASLDSVELRIWIYTGTQGNGATSPTQLTASNSRLADPTYILEGTAITIGSNQVVSFEIASLVKDFIDSNLSLAYSATNTVWVDMQALVNTNNTIQVSTAEQFLGLDGYVYSTDTNEDIDNVIRLSNRNILKLSDENVSIPVLRQSIISYSFEKDGEIVSSGTEFTDSLISDEQIVYLNNSHTYITSFRQRCIATGGIFEYSKCLEGFECENEIFGIDKLNVEYDSNPNPYTTGDVTSEAILFDNVDESLYEPRKLTFVNKYGAFQDVWFFKNSKKKLDVKSETWNRRNLILNNNVSRPTSVRRNTTVNETITLNSGFYPESNNVVFEELMQSNSVWIWSVETDTSTTSNPYPVLIKDTSLNLKDSITEKLINYTFTIEYAFNKMKQL